MLCNRRNCFRFQGMLSTVVLIFTCKKFPLLFLSLLYDTRVNVYFIFYFFLCVKISALFFLSCMIPMSMFISFLISFFVSRSLRCFFFVVYDIYIYDMKNFNIYVNVYFISYFLSPSLCEDLCTDCLCFVSSPPPAPPLPPLSQEVRVPPERSAPAPSRSSGTRALPAH